MTDYIDFFIHNCSLTFMQQRFSLSDECSIKSRFCKVKLGIGFKLAKYSTRLEHLKGANGIKKAITPDKSGMSGPDKEQLTDIWQQ
jgi:hypothetical protein